MITAARPMQSASANDRNVLVRATSAVCGLLNLSSAPDYGKRGELFQWNQSGRSWIRTTDLRLIRAAL